MLLAAALLLRLLALFAVLLPVTPGNDAAFGNENADIQVNIQ